MFAFAMQPFFSDPGQVPVLWLHPRSQGSLDSLMPQLAHLCPSTSKVTQARRGEAEQSRGRKAAGSPGAGTKVRGSEALSSARQSEGDLRRQGGGLTCALESGT